MQVVNVLDQTTGLNNIIDPVRLEYDHETGVQELSKAINVNIDRTGRIYRRRGYERVNSTPCHSVWQGPDRSYCVAQNSICQINEDYSFTPLTDYSYPEERCWFLNVNRDIFWSNRFQHGLLMNGEISTGWDFMMPQSKSDPRYLSEMPSGECLELFNGRIWVAVDNVIFFSEPLGYYACDKARNWFMFDSEIRMINAVDDGLYIGTTNETYWLSGNTPEEMAIRTVALSSPIKGTATKMDGRYLLSGETLQRVAVWTADDGMYAGFSEGQVLNLTKDKLTYPGGSTGTSVVVNDEWITLINA